MRDGHRDAGSRVPYGGHGAVELAFAVDDETSPTRVTVSPRYATGNTTAWLTIDVDHVVDLSAHA